jgi:DNA repair photolyase
MSIIYEPKGKAKEYCDLAANLYSGCDHGCYYCYVPEIVRKSAAEFKVAAPRKDVLKQLQKEAPKYSGREVQLCFTCDPYQAIETELKITRRAIQILHQSGVAVRILTKGGIRAVRDFDLLAAHKDLSVFGATLTFTKPEDSLKYEPGAAIPEDRIESLTVAHSMGIRTWASVEPVIDVEQSLELILLSESCVDEFKIGKLNHIANKTDWEDFGNRAIGMLRKLGKRYYIKNDLLAYLPGQPQRG